jgi:hypothetical protein
MLPDPGFAEAVFPTTLLNELLSDKGCAGVRFYNAKVSGSGTLMAVGYLADGSDLNGGIFAQPYQAAMGVEGDRVSVSDLSRRDAAEACAEIAATGATSFSSGISGQDLNNLISSSGCTAVLIQPGEGGSGLRIQPAKIEGGRAVPLDPSGTSTRAMGDPCPAMCGPKGNYINEAQLK